MLAIAEAEIVAHTALLAETTGVAPDYSGGAALGALVEALRRGHVTRGSRVVLVVTGARPQPAPRGTRLTTVAPAVADVLAALGIRS